MWLSHESLILVSSKVGRTDVDIVVIAMYHWCGGNIASVAPIVKQPAREVK